MRYARYIAPSKQRRLARKAAPAPVATAPSITQADLDAAHSKVAEACKEAKAAQAKVESMKAKVQTAKAQAQADAGQYKAMVEQIREAVQNIKSPNGTTKRIMRIIGVSTDTASKPVEVPVEDQTTDMFENAA